LTELQYSKIAASWGLALKVHGLGL